MDNLSIIHKKTYEALSDEYEARAESLQPVTEDSMSYFSSYIKPGGKVLDIGCGVGLAIHILNKRGFNATKSGWILWFKNSLAPDFSPGGA